jgi:hypothetical protein
LLLKTFVMRDHPIHGIKKAKRRFPKLPATPEAADLEELSSQYLRERNAAMRAKRLKAEMELAHARNQLIEKRLVERQLAYLLIGMRQKMLLLPGMLRMKFGEERFPHDMLEAAKGMVNEALTQLSRLPEAVEADWLERLEDEEEG